MLIRADTLLVLDLGIRIVNIVGIFQVQSNRLPGQDLHKYLYATPETQRQLKGELFMDVVFRKGSAIVELFASKDEPLLVRGDAFLVLDLRLDVVNSVRAF